MKKTLLFLFILLGNLVLTAQESGFANIGDAKIYYEQKGEGTPMIFLHGGYCDTRAWDYQFDEFSKKYKVIRFDLRGFGKSSVPDNAKPYNYAEDLKALIDYLKINKAILVGHSLGGIPAFNFTYKYPDKVLALILIESGPLYKGMFNNDDAKIFLDDLNKVDEIGKQEGKEAAKKAFLGINILKPAMKNPLSKDILVNMTMDYSGWHFENDDPRTLGAILNLSDYSDLNVPTLICTGKLSLPFYHRSMKEIHQTLPNSTLAEISSGHMIQLENPKEFNKVLKQFL